MKNLMTKWYLLWALALVYLWYNIATFNYIEYTRNKLLEEMTVKADSLSGSVEEKKLELIKALEELELTTKCIKANSQTWQLVDCTSLSYSWAVVVEVDKPTPTTALPSKDSDKKWEELNTLICSKAKINNSISPLCNNDKLTKELYQISIDRKISFTLMLWIAYAESHIWANYAKWCSKEYNNLGWLKRKITDDWWRIKDYPIPDQNWCRLYKFTSIQEYWKSKANSLYHWYAKKNCHTIECISQWYVRWDWVYKPAYNARVNTFATFNL